LTVVPAPLSLSQVNEALVLFHEAVHHRHAGGTRVATARAGLVVKEGLDTRVPAFFGSMPAPVSETAMLTLAAARPSVERPVLCVQRVRRTSRMQRPALGIASRALVARFRRNLLGGRPRSGFDQRPPRTRNLHWISIVARQEGDAACAALPATHSRALNGRQIEESPWRLKPSERVPSSAPRGRLGQLVQVPTQLGGAAGSQRLRESGSPAPG